VKYTAKTFIKVKNASEIFSSILTPPCTVKEHSKELIKNKESIFLRFL
jgi:hypothetical protein